MAQELKMLKHGVTLLRFVATGSLENDVAQAPIATNDEQEIDHDDRIERARGIGLAT
jgi:hypothetical protein